ncbi:malto-oligosyltrehalose trehalohydrolase [Paenarthrobacter sp. DKR-5]|uniref:malto-oligosyltrehalose trehalohydrolase n=1 Tax=Paenarthrobacter sp. DKR-5 TaxID=2835535 RepID=UPI001BDD17AA|nr:malto-oligosyltrehalose trehalohydrolase [Paenarthrobacter sp. DKR-5]MBT1004296.1 malto-oligosyltrehalose trehalohydrolase [Paenarthrobacter sp. DKR-5]
MSSRFDVWAPKAGKVELSAGGETIPMSPIGGGWWRPGREPQGEVDYGYLLDGSDKAFPDPRSRRQPRGVHELSRTFNPGAHEWQDGGWRGRQLAGGSIYELHIGTFTPEGTLDAAIGKLPYLVELGIDFVELLPVNGFNGTHNWGYDGVLWYTVQEQYGGPAAYQRFVDAAHRHGLGVIQDVVYNHLGPSGNYLPNFGPYMSSGGSNTWGESINLDGPDSGEVRSYILQNALMWLRDYHVDGLRLDAVHALADHTAVHLLEEMAAQVDVLSAQLGKPLFLVAESDLNDPKLITSREANGYGLTGQWSDDFHHAVHVNVTGETAGYYEDFNSLAALAKVVTRGFFHDGTLSTFRGRVHGRPLDLHKTPTWRLVTCIQNHDQVGNRAIGDRISATESYGRLAVAAVLNLTAPFTPMLFMGEEYGASTPWQFFTSHPEPELGKATAEGRIKEFERMGWDAAVVPDPQDPATFERSKLDWSEAGQGDHARLLELYRALLRLRREVPELTDPRFGEVAAEFDESNQWFLMRRGALAVAVNLADGARSVPVAFEEILLSTEPGIGPGAGTLDLPGASAVVGRTA